MRFLVENYPYEVILPTFPVVSACFEFLDFVTAITYVTDVTAKHGRPLRKSRNHFIPQNALECSVDTIDALMTR